MTQYPYPFNHEIPKYPKISDDPKEKEKIKERWMKMFNEITQKENESSKLF